MQNRMKDSDSRRRSSPPGGIQGKDKITGRKKNRVYLNSKMQNRNRMMIYNKKLQVQKKISRFSLNKEAAKRENIVKEDEVQRKGSYIAPSNRERNMLIDKTAAPADIYKQYKSRKLKKLRKKYIRKDRNELIHCCKAAALRKIATKLPYVNKNLKQEKDENDKEKQTEEKVKQDKKKKKGGFVKDAMIAAAKGQVQSLEGGEEVLEAADTIKTTVQGAKSFIKTAADTGTSMYCAGKKTAGVIAGVAGGKKRMARVRSRQEYNEKRIHDSQKNRENSKNVTDNKNGKEPEEKRKKKSEKKKQSVARQRILTYIKNKSSGKQKDSLGSVAKDIAKNKAKQVGGRIAAALGKKILTVAASAVGAVFIPVIIIVGIIGMLCKSPFAILFPNDGKEENIQDVLYEYYEEFAQDVQSKASEADQDGYDRIEVKSETGEIDAEVSKSNYMDVLCIFAEKYGYDMEIINVTDKAKKRLKAVFHDMNYYSVKDEIIKEKNVQEKKEKTKNKSEKGTLAPDEETIEKKIRTITITQKNWQDMIDTYKFGRDEKAEIEELMELAEDAEIGGDTDDYSTYTGTGVCIDGKVYDNPNAPVYKGICAGAAKKTRNYIRPILRAKGMEAYIDIIISIVQQESTFGKGDNGNWLQVNGYSGEPGMASVKAGINHFEGLIKICKDKKITDIKVLVQSYNFGWGYINYAGKNGGRDTMALQRKFQYIQNKNGRYGTAGYSQSVMSRVKGQKIKETSMPQYFQMDTRWCNVRFGTSTIGKSGCGVCSLSMVISYWTGKKVTPKSLVERCHSYYVAGSGASWSMIPAIASQYNLKCKSLGTSKEQMVEELKKGHTIIAIMHKGYFTRNGHFIVLRSMDGKGNISVNDCGSRERTSKTYSAGFIQSNNPANYWSVYK